MSRYCRHAACIRLGVAHENRAGPNRHPLAGRQGQRRASAGHVPARRHGPIQRIGRRAMASGIGALQREPIIAILGADLRAFTRQGLPGTPCQQQGTHDAAEQRNQNAGHGKAKSNASPCPSAVSCSVHLHPGTVDNCPSIVRFQPGRRYGRATDVEGISQDQPG